MATFDIAFSTRLEDVVVLQTFVGTDIQTADSITVSGAGNGMDGTFTVISTEPYLYIGKDTEGDLLFDWSVIMENQVLYTDAGADVERSVATGTITWTQTCTWITNQMVLDWLGIAPASANDTAFITVCTEAANALAYRRRRESGYTDSLSTVPGADAKLGTIMYAASLYRQRGSVDSFQSFEAFAAGNAPVGSIGEILRLWGCNRAQVA